jgi:hypothetical protein
MGRRPQKNYTYAEVLISAWSSDSREILLAVEPGETTSEWGELLVPEAPYGYYIFNRETRTIHPVLLPRTLQLRAWLPDGRFLGIVPGQRPHEDGELVILRRDDAKGIPIRDSTGTLQQVQASTDGKWLIGLLVSNDERHRTVQIVKINLATMFVTPVLSLSSWTGNERPGLSPSNDLVSYVRETPMVKGIPPETLIVDQRPLYECRATIEYRWVSERDIAVACQDEVLLLDAASGTPLSRHAPLPAVGGTVQKSPTRTVVRRFPASRARKTPGVVGGALSPLLAGWRRGNLCVSTLTDIY